MINRYINKNKIVKWEKFYLCAMDHNPISVLYLSAYDIAHKIYIHNFFFLENGRYREIVTTICYKPSHLKIAQANYLEMTHIS